MSIIVKNSEGQSIVLVDKPITTVSVKGLVGGTADAYYVHTQALPESVWTITHNLNKKPSVTIVDSTDAVVYGDVNYLNDNQLTLTFVGAFSGKAYLN